MPRRRKTATNNYIPGKACDLPPSTGRPNVAIRAACMATNSLTLGETPVRLLHAFVIKGLPALCRSVGSNQTGNNFFLNGT